MKITIKFYTYLRDLAKKKMEELEVLDNITVEQLLKLLSTRFGQEFHEYVFDEKTGKPQTYLQYVVDGKTISTLQGLETKLSEGCTFSIIPPAGGG